MINYICRFLSLGMRHFNSNFQKFIKKDSKRNLRGKYLWWLSYVSRIWWSQFYYNFTNQCFRCYTYIVKLPVNKFCRLYSSLTVLGWGALKEALLEHFFFIISWQCFLISHFLSVQFNWKENLQLFAFLVDGLWE